MIGLWTPKDGDWQTVLARLSDSAAAEWRADVSKVQKLVKIVGDTDRYQPLPGSALSQDDEKVGPYGVSQVALHNLSTGLTQLHAAQEAMHGGSDRLIAAATLLRSALESLAVAFWIVHPDDQSERISRALTWFMRNVTDERVAYADFVGKELLGDNRVANIRKIRRRNGIDVSGTNAGIQSTSALRYADSALNVPNHLLLYIWRLCSGVAHGRPWSFANLSTAVPGVHGVTAEKVSLDEASLRVPFRIAVVLLDALLEKLDERRESNPTLPLDSPGRTDS